MRRWVGILIVTVLSFVSACSGCEEGTSQWDLDDDIGTSADAGADGFVASDDVEVRPDLGVPSTCGDGVVDDGEVCDGAALNGRSCQTFGFPGGELGCMDSCAGFIVGDCTGIPSWTPTHEHPCEACGPDEICVDDTPEGLHCEPACTGTALTDISQLDTNVRTHTVSASVTIGGEAVDQWVTGDNLGVVIFEPRSGPETEFNLDETGSFEGEVFEGTYNVYWSGQLDRPALPLLLASEVHIGHGRQFSFDAEPPQAVTIDLRAPDWFGEFSGEVEVHYAGDWAPTKRETLDLEMAAEHELVFYLGEPVDLVLRRIESARFAGASGEYRGDVGPLPHTIAERIAEPPDAPVVLPVHRLTFEVPQGGDPPADERVTVRLSVEENRAYGEANGFVERDLAYGESATVPVFGGDYWFQWREFDDVTKRQVTIASDETRTVPVEANWIRAELDLSSIDFGDAVGMNLSLRHARFGRVRERGSQEPSSQVNLNVPEGEYDILIDTLRDGEAGADWRANDVEVGDGAVVSPTFVERREVRLQGEILRRGETMPDNTYTETISDGEETITRVESRATVRFDCIDDCFGGAYRGIAGTGPATYDVSLEPGVYHVSIQTPGGSDWNLPSPQDILPVPGTVLHPRLVVTEGGRRDFDIRMDRVDVTLLEDGGELSSLSSWPSWLRDEYDTRGGMGITPVAPRNIYSYRPFGESAGADGAAAASFYAYPGYYSVSVRLNGIGSKRRALALHDDTSVSFDVSLAHLPGTLTWNGEPWWEQPSEDGDLDFVGPGLAYKTAELADDGGFGVSVFAEPQQLLWRRWRAYDYRLKLGQFTIFDGCPARR